MKRIFLFVTLLVATTTFFTSCEEDDYEFKYKNYYGEIVYPENDDYSGETFTVNSIYFKDNGNFIIRMTIPASELRETKYISSITGKYDYVRDGNKKVNITLGNVANVDFLSINGASKLKTSEENPLASRFPTQYVINSNGKVYSLDNATGIKITARGN
ncbi:hypothetical protein M2138_000566 [Dysgonomonadaceae bacterium PH5-43]|nr:hypothetical protein [Dysgonomonadaceae bacterium PH5-43]